MKWQDGDWRRNDWKFKRDKQGDLSDTERGRRIDITVRNAVNNVPGPAVRVVTAVGTKPRRTIFRMKRLTGVRALIVAMTPENRTWSSQGGQEGRFDRTKPWKANHAYQKECRSRLPLAGETPGIAQWAHRVVWTDRMLETLVETK